METLSLRPEDDFHPDFCLLNYEKLIENQGYSDMLLTIDTLLTCDMLLTMPRRYFIKVSLSLSLSLSCKVLSCPPDLLKNSLCISSKLLINIVKGYLPLLTETTF